MPGAVIRLQGPRLALLQFAAVRQVLLFFAAAGLLMLLIFVVAAYRPGRTE